MTGEETVAVLGEWRKVLKREMPHIGCRPMISAVPQDYKCDCYKCSLWSALLRADTAARDALGMPPF